MKLSIFLLLIILWCVAGQPLVHYNVLVAQKRGVGNHTTIAEAIRAAPSHSPRRYKIKIKSGFYRENIDIPTEKTNIMLLGEGMENTIIWGDRSMSRGIKTFDSATASINGDGFIAMDITFENGAGPQGMQAVAVRSDAQSVFYRCQFLGYQDTLYAKSKMQFYRDCKIFGTVDFIFGDARVILQNCDIYARKPLGNQNTITAQGRKTPKGDGGTVIHNCSFEAAPDLQKSRSMVRTYLGRPWETYSRVIVMQSNLSDLIDSRGWLEWQGHRNDKVFYAEYDNRGGSSSTKSRVRWSGVRLLKAADANLFTVRNFIRGDTWIPKGIPCNLDLI